MARRRTVTIADEMYGDRNPFLDLLLGIISFSERRYGETLDPSALRVRAGEGNRPEKAVTPPVRSILR